PSSTPVPYTTLFRSPAWLAGRRPGKWGSAAGQCPHEPAGAKVFSPARDRAERPTVALLGLGQTRCKLFFTYRRGLWQPVNRNGRSEEHTSELPSPCN